MASKESVANLRHWQQGYDRQLQSMSKSRKYLQAAVDSDDKIAANHCLYFLSRECLTAAMHAYALGHESLQIIKLLQDSHEANIIRFKMADIIKGKFPAELLKACYTALILGKKQDALTFLADRQIEPCFENKDGVITREELATHLAALMAFLRGETARSKELCELNVRQCTEILASKREFPKVAEYYSACSNALLGVILKDSPRFNLALEHVVRLCGKNWRQPLLGVDDNYSLLSTSGLALSRLAQAAGLHISFQHPLLPLELLR